MYGAANFSNLGPIVSVPVALVMSIFFRYFSTFSCPKVGILTPYSILKFLTYCIHWSKIDLHVFKKAINLLTIIFSSPVQSTGRAIVVILASALPLPLALPLPFPSRHF